MTRTLGAARARTFCTSQSNRSLLLEALEQRQLFSVTAGDSATADPTSATGAALSAAISAYLQAITVAALTDTTGADASALTSGTADSDATDSGAAASADLIASIDTNAIAASADVSLASSALVAGSVSGAALIAGDAVNAGLVANTAGVGANPQTVLPYLDDEDPNSPPADSPGTPPIDQQMYPRLNMTQGAVGNIEVASKYQTVAYDGTRIREAETMKVAHPDTTVLRYFLPRSYQIENADNGKGMPFDTTGPVTANGSVYAGHWLYLAGTTTKQVITPTTLTLHVADASKITAGQYVVIYDGPPGSFLNAEHAKVASVNVAAETITLASRGYKSVALAHGIGAIVAQHDLGAAGNGTTAPPEDWAYNISSGSPRDAAGNQYNVAAANWLAQHLNVDGNGNPVGTFKFDGIMFDGETGNFLVNPADDTNNDLIGDAGIDAAGNNLHGAGLDTFYATVRNLLGPSAILVGGTGSVRGFDSLNGVQGEGYPHVNTSYVSPAKYNLTDQKLADYTYHIHDGAYGPQYNEVLNKTPTLVYPTLQNGGTAPTSNSPFRYSLGFALLENGSYGQDRNGIDAWWDEYSVDVVPGSPTFGQAIPNNNTNEANVRAHEGWLGNPLGDRQRLYDPATFAAGNTLLANGNYDSAITGWTGADVTLTRDATPANVFAGTGSLHISPQTVFTPNIDSASANSGLVALVANTTYTVSFEAKSSALRELSVGLAKMEQSVFVDTDWSRHVLTFTVAKSGNYNLSFLVGRESTDVWVDDVYLFKGSADVFQRDFDNGTIFVNATPVAQTITLSDTYQRIKGTQDPINNGATVSGTITIGPYDSAILIRKGASSVVPTAASNLTANVLSSTQVNLTWQDHSSNESGFKVERSTDGGVTYAVRATTAPGIETYSDTGLTAGVSYVYRIQATNSIGDSVASNVVGLTTPKTATPAAPSTLVALTGSTNLVALTWVDQANNETGYRIERQIGLTGIWIEIATTKSNVKVFNDKTVLPGILYDYRVRATNAAGNSAYSNTAQATTLLAKLLGIVEAPVTSISVGLADAAAAATAPLAATPLAATTFGLASMPLVSDESAADDTDTDLAIDTDPASLSTPITQPVDLLLAQDFDPTDDDLDAPTFLSLFAQIADEFRSDRPAV